MQHVQTMGCYSVVPREDILAHAVIWMKRENMLSEMSRRRTTNVVPLVGHTSSGQIHRVAKGSEGGVAGGRWKFSGDGWW